MKYLFTGTIALLALASISAARAADMPVKAPAAPPAPVYSWTGFYIGANGGYGWNNVTFTHNDPNTTQDPINGVPNGSATMPTPTSGTASGWLGGLEAGYNWETPQRIVYGIEGDFDLASITLSQTTSGPTGVIYQTGPGTTTFAANFANANESIRTNWLSTIRGRIGYAVQDRLLLFATGGLAIGQVKSQGDVLLGQNGQIAAGTFPIWSGSNEAVKTGFTIGGGAEWAVLETWTVKAEYLWYDLGTVSHPLNCASPAAGFCTAVGFYPTLGDAVSSVRGSIVRVGINYKLN